MSFLPYKSGSGFGWVGAFGASAIVHGAVAVAILGTYGSFLRPLEPDKSDPQFTITLERLDADTLAGALLQEGVAGATEQTPAETLDPNAATDPQPVDAVPPEQPPEQPPTVEPATPEPVPTDQLTAEPVAPIEPDTAGTTEQIMPDAVTPAPIEPDPLVATPVAPNDPDLNPILPETIDTAVLAPVGTDPSALSPVVPIATDPTSITPVATGAGTGLVAVAPAPTSSQTVAAVSNVPPPPAAPAQPAAARPPAAPATAQDLAIGDLIQRIRGEVSDDCLIALPRRDGQDGVGLAMIAAQDGAMETFAQNVLTIADEGIRQTRTLVDPRQCPALTYIRQNQDYPATRMGLRIDSLEIESGGRLTGVLRGGTGRYITLLLVDDNGVVQDLQRFLSFSGNLARFDVPVTRDGPTRDTSQILLAIATRRPPDIIKARNGQLAQEVFSGLEGELGPAASLAMATFDVR